MIIRFRDYRSVKTYGKEIFTTTSPEAARQYMRDNASAMRFLVGGGKGDPLEPEEIYWDVLRK